MEVLRCGSCNYLVLLSLQRRVCGPQVCLFEHLGSAIVRNENVPVFETILTSQFAVSLIKRFMLSTR